MEDRSRKNSRGRSYSSDSESNHVFYRTNNNMDNRLLGIKRPSKEAKEINEYLIQRRKQRKFDYNEKKKIFEPSLEIPLVTFKLYCELLKEKNYTNEELTQLYEEYKENHEQKNNEKFFNDHKNDEWFLEKYHPYIYTLLNKIERSEMCQKKAKIFFDKYNISSIINRSEVIDTDLQRNNFNYCFDLKEEHEYDKSVRIFYSKANLKENKFEEIERDLNRIPIEKEEIQKEIGEKGKPYYFYEPDYLSLYSLSYLSTNTDVTSVINLLKDFPGFISLSLSEPDTMNDFRRHFWAYYDNDMNVDNVAFALKRYQVDNKLFIRLIKSKTDPFAPRIKITPPLFNNRLNEDLVGSYKIIQILDDDRGINNNPIIQKIHIDDIDYIDDEEKVRILNLNILYLRKIHGFCYYCLKGFFDERSLIKRCFLHLRHYIKLGNRNKISKRTFGEELIKVAIDYDKLFSKKLNDIINDKNVKNNELLLRPKFLYNDKNVIKILENEKKEFAKNKYVKIKEDKYECTICSKKFMAPHFIEEHINNRHYEVFKNTVYGQLMKENYLDDKNKINRREILTNKADFDEY